MLFVWFAFKNGQFLQFEGKISDNGASSVPVMYWKFYKESTAYKPFLH